MASISAVHQNVLTTVATVVYCKVVVGGCDAAVERGWIPPDISRKVIHVAAGSWCLFWPYFRTDTTWTWQLNVVVPAVYSIQLVVKGLLWANPHDPDVKTMSRSGKPIELCQGPLLFTLIMMYCGLYQFQTEIGVYILGALTYGDGLAPLVGKRWPIGKYPTFSTDQSQYKTLSGSATMFLGTLLGIVILHAGIVGVEAKLDWNKMVGVATTATVAEAISGIWDNPTIVLATLWYCQNNDA